MHPYTNTPLHISKILKGPTKILKEPYKNNTTQNILTAREILFGLSPSRRRITVGIWRERYIGMPLVEEDSYNRNNRIFWDVWKLTNHIEKPRQNGKKMTSFRGAMAKLGAGVDKMNWVDRLRTSADKRMWSGRRAVVMRTGRRAELLGVKLGCPRSRCRAAVSDVLCVRSYVHFVCVCVYMCMCVCVRT